MMSDHGWLHGVLQVHTAPEGEHAVGIIHGKGCVKSIHVEFA